MAGFFNKLKGSSAASPTSSSKDGATKKKEKEEPAPELTPLEKMLQNASPLTEGGTDRFFGLENFGNTCYCNSIVQALFYSDCFRDNVMNFPPHSPSDTPNGTLSKVQVSIRPPPVSAPAQPPGKQKGMSTSQVLKQRQAINQQMPGQVGIRPEDKPDTPEYKKKQAMLKGPILELARENATAYGMEESTFTGLKDIFLALMESKTRTGVLSPQRFLEIFKRDNEMFRNSMHQDAHEFYGLVLNDVITHVEASARQLQLQAQEAALTQSVQNALASAMATQTPGLGSPGTGWVHDIFEGVLTSETKCLTCETASQRDETFLDLSIDLEEHSSVTSCLRKFSAEEMLCERNKFHCDHCGGLQEAEKRMKVKKLPKILTLHLKRFKYTEDYSRLQKLFHRVVYPYHLRMFNTTDEAEDPDRLYELYAVVVHIGGNAYHGHYVSIIKTKDRGWVLFDDEMVEPVDKHFVRNFFGDKPGMATAYVLFYQETTFEKFREEQEREGKEEVKLASQAADMAQEHSDKADSASLRRQTTQPSSPIREKESMATLAHAITAPTLPTSPLASDDHPPVPKVPVALQNGLSKTGTVKVHTPVEEEKDTPGEKDEEPQDDVPPAPAISQPRRQVGHSRAVSSSMTAGEYELDHKRRENGSAQPHLGLLDRTKRGSKSMSKKSFSLFHHKDKSTSQALHGDGHDKPDKHHEKLKDRLSFSLGRKKSTNILSS